MNNQANLGTAVGNLISWPFAAVRDWFRFLNGLPPHERELTRASHGAVMIVLAFKLPGMHVVPGDYLMLALFVLVSWGIFWVAIGASRSRAPRDNRLLTRAVAKIVTGIVIIHLRPDLRELDPLPPFGYEVVILAAWWCIITGCVKFFLLLRPQPTDPGGVGIGNMPDGNKGFGKWGKKT